MSIRIINLKNINIAESEIAKVGADPAAWRLLASKAVNLAIKLEGITPYTANILKQEMLSRGGDVAVNRGVVSNSVEKTDAIILGTMRQIEKLVEKLRQQPPSLQEIGKQIKNVLATHYPSHEKRFLCRDYSLLLGKQTYIMGILNATPDSFSDGGRFNDLKIAIERAKQMMEQGADIIDIGGESTKPGFTPVDADEEIKRIVPIIAELKKDAHVPISVDTSKAKVAEKAIEAGADIVNDVLGFLGDPDIAKVSAEGNVGVVLMHNNTDNNYDDIMREIIEYFFRGIEKALIAGVKQQNIMLDPGIGFAKTYEQNLMVLNKLSELCMLGFPVLLGTSRKSVIGNTLGLPTDQRIEGTAATVALGISEGVDVVRVHDVAEISRVVRMTDAVVRLKT